jgi:hypothetical protein
VSESHGGRLQVSSREMCIGRVRFMVSVVKVEDDGV